MAAQVAVVTGSGRGIGRSIALALAENGWDLVLNYRSNAQSAEEVARLVEAKGRTAVLVRADIALAADRERLLGETLNRYAGIDLLVNNAGMAPRQRLDILETTEGSYDEVMEVNLKGPFFLTQAVARQMIQFHKEHPASRPKIINIGSMSSYASSANRPEYCLSKAGVTMMTNLFAARLADEGIQVFEIQPGIIETDMTGAVHEKYDRLIADGLTPIRRWGQPEDVARTVLAVAGDYLPFSTGEIIHVDGGFHLRRL